MPRITAIMLGVMKTAMNDIFMHDQQPVIAMITRYLHDQIYELYEQMGIHAYMNDFLEISFIHAWIPIGS